LAKACLKKDVAAQKQLYSRYKLPMFSICLRYSNDRMEAEDILQEGFLKVYRDLHQYKPAKAPLGAWIRRVMINTALENIRKKRRIPYFDDINDYNESIEFNAGIFEELGRKELVELIQTLPNGYKTVFNMYVVDGYTHKEIADRLSISENTSKTQLFKAKRALAKLVVQKTASVRNG